VLHAWICDWRGTLSSALLSAVPCLALDLIGGFA
jgi:hypothetical protein